jgi:alkylation response protein AidB-like acyl-CoA dehydrogenase
MGYKGVETCELIFDNVSVPESNLLGENEGQGFRQVMSGLEVGRINIGARAVGVARAAFEDAIHYSQQRKTFGKAISDHQAIQLKLAEMYTKIQAARQLVSLAAKAKDRGDRCDLEAGMAKLFATETAHEVTMDAMRIFGGIGYTKATNVERYFRDAPLMIVAEGTNEIQKVTIARNLLKMYKI